jgi:hypothetical protein
MFYRMRVVPGELLERKCILLHVDTELPSNARRSHASLLWSRQKWLPNGNSHWNKCVPKSVMLKQSCGVGSASGQLRKGPVLVALNASNAKRQLLFQKCMPGNRRRRS